MGYLGLVNDVYELNDVKNTPAQSKIEFAAHLIKISSQITVYMKELVA